MGCTSVPRTAMSSRRRWCWSTSAMLALTVALASAFRQPIPAATPSAGGAFVSWSGCSALVSRSARAFRAPRTRRPAHRRLGMQAADGGPEAELGGGGEELPQTVFPPRRPKTYKLKKGQVGVRFINTSGDPDVCVAAYPGETVTKVAKRAGVKIATACNTGICGTCMTDLEDPNGKGYRPGFQVVRACITPVKLVPGAEEMVLDIYRSRSKSGKLNNQLVGSGKSKGDSQDEAETVADAMKRFADGWEDDYQRDSDESASSILAKKNFATTLTDPPLIKTPISYNAQRRMENKYMYDDLPANVKRNNAPWGGRDLEEKMDAARQVDIRQRMQRERRERVNYFLDNTDRPIAKTGDIMALSQEEVDTRSRFFNSVPDTWEEAYGPPNPPEVQREIDEMAGRRSEGISAPRMAAYRSARQIPRYRFFGDPPLKEQDETYFSEQEDPMRRIKFEDAAELDRLAIMSGAASQDKHHFVFRDSRTGRIAPAHKAGTPGTVRAEMREKALPVCSACEGTGLQECMQCRAMGINRAANGLNDLVCPKCHGQGYVPCPACAGSGVGKLS